MSILQSDRPRPAIYIDLPSQTLELWLGRRFIRKYSISSSAHGVGTTPGSLRTPTGVFCVWRKVGHTVASGIVFKARRATPQIGRADDPADLVQTRILWLHGLHLHNRNTRARYIYIHGTNHEDKIGSPASHGCIRMRNSDVIDLFNRVPVGTRVFITP